MAAAKARATVGGSDNHGASMCLLPSFGIRSEICFPRMMRFCPRAIIMYCWGESRAAGVSGGGDDGSDSSLGVLGGKKVVVGVVMTSGSGGDDGGGGKGSSFGLEILGLQEGRKQGKCFLWATPFPLVSQGQSDRGSLNMQEGMEGNPMAGTMKNFSRILGFLTIPFTATFPKVVFGNTFELDFRCKISDNTRSGSKCTGLLRLPCLQRFYRERQREAAPSLPAAKKQAIFCYWITSNLFSLTYGLVLKRPPVRKFLNLPEIVPRDATAPRPSFPLFGGSKQMTQTISPSSPVPAQHAQPPEKRISSSSVISHRIRNLERTYPTTASPSLSTLTAAPSPISIITATPSPISMITATPCLVSIITICRPTRNLKFGENHKIYVKNLYV
ncbi:hypothetical protein Taro_047619 [Colocasia esculenta]|uniref:Uncharacterized protein n=1 Tax=Colocasia esculenta TaxID=4460 RepID=A0A843X7A6_COLES|nr:hypothetical protein [Colocasia esculenta]